jgi:hypothetical protein
MSKPHTDIQTAAAQAELDRLLKIQQDKARQSAVPVVTLEDELATARVKLFEAQEADRLAAIAALRPVELEHERNVLRLLEPLAAEVEKAQAVGMQLRALGGMGADHARYNLTLMQLPQALKDYRKRLATATGYTDQPVIK